MQRFVAELSRPIDKSDFETSWHSNPAIGVEPKVDFVFVGQRVSVLVHSDDGAQWPSASFYRTFSAAVRRLNPVCNIRWL